MELINAINFWEWANSDLGTFHLVMALVALALGPVIFSRRKGDVMHRLLGLTYAFAMIAGNVSALMIYSFTGGVNFFHIAAIASLATVTSGLVGAVLYAVSRKPMALDFHLQMMSWSYFGLVLAAIAESGTRALPMIFAQDDYWRPFGVFMGVAGFVMAIYLNIKIRPVRKRWVKG